MRPSEQNSPPCCPCSHGHPKVWVRLVVCVALAVLVGVGVFTVIYSGESTSLDSSFRYPAATIFPVSAGMRRVSSVVVPLEKPRDLAVAPDGQLIVVGDRAACIRAAGEETFTPHALESEPHAVAVAHDGMIYIALKNRVTVLGSDGRGVAQWAPLDAGANLTGIAVGPAGRDDVFVADAGHNVVYRYSRAGVLLGRLGEKGVGGAAGLIVPSHHFDVLVGLDGLVRIVNPGRHRIEAYTFEGLYEEPLTWGPAVAKEARFVGCCNPMYLAQLPDGRFVTSEKGLSYVKVFSESGEFQQIVSSPPPTRPGLAQLAFPIAAGPTGRIFVLDRATRQIHGIQDGQDTAPANRVERVKEKQTQDGAS